MGNITSKIDFKDISVVIQGAYDESITPIAISSVRKYLPGACVILSTWKGSKVPENICDKNVFSDDPGGFEGNANRQIVSTINGLKEVKTKYSLKMRSDFELLGNDFLRYFGCFDKKSNQFKILEDRVICFGWKFRRFSSNSRIFHPGDFYYFGLTSDLLKLFDIPHVYSGSLPDSASPRSNLYNRSIFNFSTEQYLWCAFLSANLKNFPPFPDLLKNRKLRESSEKYYANNLIFLNYPEFAIKTNKDNLRKNNFGTNSTAYSFAEWFGLYKKYCDKNAQLKSFKVSKKGFAKILLIKLILCCGGIAQIFCAKKSLREKVRDRFSKIADSLYFK